MREVVLFGSLARGDWSARSDADLVVIVDEAPADVRERARPYLPAGPLGIATDVFVYTPAEARQWSARLSSEIAAGIVLYRRPDTAGVVAG